jgi:hypothetical protein
MDSLRSEFMIPFHATLEKNETSGYTRIYLVETVELADETSE